MRNSVILEGELVQKRPEASAGTLNSDLPATSDAEDLERIKEWRNGNQVREAKSPIYSP